MASQSWLESSLRRSSRMGREVLERAQRRSVDWSSVRLSTRPEYSVKRVETQEDLVHSNLDKAFAAIVEIMTETSNQCKNFYQSANLAKASNQEKTHVCRYHSLRVPGTSQQTPTERSRVPVSSEPEDFLIEVSPGTYAITAGMQDVSSQTQVVRVDAGESRTLTFNL
ncbi:A-kinase-interacting protein 1 [Chanos chanos]|uniref:A-kinase-interacting protein 1 n=1 Tax=Chanos chanos TaxID=29144 RepID=A0A6J2WPV8_CHACN|nr:A-kinase-interacting protein 1 [Chanos chanos]